MSVFRFLSLLRIPVVAAALVLLLTGFQVAASSAQEPDDDLTISGTITLDGVAVSGAVVDLFAQEPDRSRGEYIASASTDTDGVYSFSVSAQCFVLIFIAPEGQTYNGSRFLRQSTCVEAEVAEVIDAELDSALPPEALITGGVRDTDGDVFEAVRVTLFETAADGGRGAYLGDAFTAADGTYSLEVDAGCYTLTFIAPPDRVFANGGEFFQTSTCVEVGETSSGMNALLRSDQPSDTFIGGTVTFANGDPATGVSVDLFTEVDGGGRGSFLSFTTTGADGTYTFDVLAGCYITTFIAPAGETFVGGGQFAQGQACVEPGQTVSGVDAVLDSEVIFPSSIGGTISDGDQGPAEGVKVTRWAVAGDGSRSDFLNETFSGPDGTYSFGVDPGCYWFVYVAPAGETFGGTPFLEQFLCVEDGVDVTDLDAMLDAVDPPVGVTVSVGDTTVTELDIDGLRNAQVVFSLNTESAETVIVNYTTVDGSATVAGGDYIARSGELRFAPGRTSLVRAIRTLGDVEVEGTETFTVELSDPVNATIADGVGVVTILDNDGPVPPTTTTTTVAPTTTTTTVAPTTTTTTTLPIPTTVPSTTATTEATTTTSEAAPTTTEATTTTTDGTDGTTTTVS